MKEFRAKLRVKALKECKHQWRVVWDDYYSHCYECHKCKKSVVHTYD